MDCPDCPDLDNDVERPADPSWKPRARCCRDDAIELRREGVEVDATLPLAELRIMVDRLVDPEARAKRAEAVNALARREAERLVRESAVYGNRQERRALAADIRKGK